MPDTKVKNDDEYYKANALFHYYRQKLAPALRNKNPYAYDDMMRKLIDFRKSQPKMDYAKENDFIEANGMKEYLTQEEMRSILGKDDFNKFMNSLAYITSAEKSDYSQKDVKGANEEKINVGDILFGKRLATLPINTKLSVKGPSTTYSRTAVYDPTKKDVVMIEQGDKTLYK